MRDDEQLEPRLRRMEISVVVVWALMLILAGVMIFRQWDRPVIPDQIKVKQIQIVDDDGKPLVMIGAKDGAGLMQVWGKAGGKTYLVGRPTGGALVITNNEGKEIGGINASDTSNGQMGLATGRGEMTFMAPQQQ